MKIVLAIYDILYNSGSGDVFDLVGARIYPNVAKQATTFPFIVYQTTGVEPNDTKDGVSTVDGNSFMVLCYSETYTQVADLAQKSRIALDRKTGTYNTIEVQTIQFTGYDEDFEIEGDGQGVYVQSLSFNLRQINPTG